jgi:hypothetical protein
VAARSLGTPPSFSRDYPRPLYSTRRFIPLQELVDGELTYEARRPVPEARPDAYAELQRLAPHGDVAPPGTGLAYAPAQPPPAVLPPQPRANPGSEARPREVVRPRAHPHQSAIPHRRPAPGAHALHLSAQTVRRPGHLAPPLDIRPPAARRP